MCLHMYLWQYSHSQTQDNELQNVPISYFIKLLENGNLLSSWTSAISSQIWSNWLFTIPVLTYPSPTHTKNYLCMGKKNFDKENKEIAGHLKVRVRITVNPSLTNILNITVL